MWAAYDQFSPVLPFGLARNRWDKWAEFHPTRGIIPSGAIMIRLIPDLVPDVCELILEYVLRWARVMYAGEDDIKASINRMSERYQQIIMCREFSLIKMSLGYGWNMSDRSFDDGPDDLAFMEIYDSDDGFRELMCHEFIGCDVTRAPTPAAAVEYIVCNHRWILHTMFATVLDVIRNQLDTLIAMQ